MLSRITYSVIQLTYAETIFLLFYITIIKTLSRYVSTTGRNAQYFSAYFCHH